MGESCFISFSFLVRNIYFYRSLGVRDPLHLSVKEGSWGNFCVGYFVSLCH